LHGTLQNWIANAQQITNFSMKHLELSSCATARGYGYGYGSGDGACALAAHLAIGSTLALSAARRSMA
jgi:hypothetical protein